MGRPIKLFIPYAGLNKKDFIEATESQEELLSLLDGTIYTAEEITDDLISVTNSLELIHTASEELTIESYKEALDSLGLSTEDMPYTISTEDLKSIMEKVITGIKHLVSKLIDLFKKMISYVVKLFTKLTGLEEKYEALKEETELSLEAYEEISGLELDRLKKLVFLTWPYYHTDDTISKVLEKTFKSFRIRERDITNSLYTIGEVMDEIMDKIGRVMGDKKIHPDKPFSIDKSLDNFEYAALEYTNGFNEILFNSGYKYIPSLDKIPPRYVPSHVELNKYNDKDLVKLTVTYKSIDNGHDKVEVSYRIRENDFNTALTTASKYKEFTRDRVAELGLIFIGYLKQSEAKRNLEKENMYDYLQRFVTGIEQSKEILLDPDYLRYINTTKNLIVMFSLAHITTVKLYRENFKQALATLRLLYDVVKNKVN